MILVSWNVRGVGNLLKRRCVKDALCDLHPDWIGLQETKLSSVDSSVIAELVGWPDFGFATSPSIKSAGGFICCWNLAYFYFLI